jgi:hypothetical protein
MTIRIFGAAMACLALAGCHEYSEPKMTLSESFGDSVRHNIAVQTINPEGSQEFGTTGLEGHRAAVAIDAYQKATEKELEAVTTSDQ